MAILEILTNANPILRKKSKPVNAITPEIKKIRECLNLISVRMFNHILPLLTVLNGQIYPKKN